MAKSNTQMQQWDLLIQQHRTLFDSHISFLSHLREECFTVASVPSILRLCQVQAENVTKTLKEFQDAVRSTMKKTVEVPAAIPQQDEHHIADPTLVPKELSSTAPPAVSAAGPSTVDASGLFMTDTNPTPIEELLKINRKATSIRTKSQSNGPAKRKGWETSNIPITVNSAGGDHEPTRKRARTENQNSNMPQTPQTPEEEESFTRKVEAKLKAKEERRKARIEKKRKRESGGSTSDAIKKAKPKKKRLKKNNSGGDSTGVQVPNGVSSNGQRNDRKRSGPNTDSHPAVAGQSDNGGGPNKKRKKS